MTERKAADENQEWFNQIRDKRVRLLNSSRLGSVKGGVISAERFGDIKIAVLWDDNEIPETLQSNLLAFEGTPEFVGRHITTGVTVSNSVEHPAHYNMDPSGVECISIIRWRNFNIGNAIKYLWRAGLKTSESSDPIQKQIEDLEKAVFYIQDEIDRIKSSNGRQDQ